MPDLIRVADKLQLLLTEFQLKPPDAEVPLAYLCVLDNHGRQKFDAEILRQYCAAEAAGVKPLIVSTDARPLVNPDRLITR